MLRFVVLTLVRVIASTFFRRIDVIGAANVPADGPLIFAGNHPNALMDGWLLAARCGRWPLHFLANAKLWKYRGLRPFLDASGAIAVYRREEHEGDVDNRDAFERVYEVLQSRDCMGIFPEGVSHTESQLVRLKTGTARIALEAAVRGVEDLMIVPSGLNYIHRHRFRSQVLIEFGTPIRIDEHRIRDYLADASAAVRRLTDEIAASLAAVTLNAPDWATMRVIQTARRLYKPSSTVLSPGQYVELNRRFLDRYLATAASPQSQRLRAELEDYQARLDMLGIKDHQLRQPVTPSLAFRRVALRSLLLLLILPLALPGALLHLPVGWLAAAVGERFSYEMDDVATLKVLASLLLLPVLYILLAVLVGMQFGTVWSLVTLIALPCSFLISVRLVEVEAGLLISMLTLLRLARLRTDVDDLRRTRAELVAKIRAAVERDADPAMPRMFSDTDFAAPET